jgi:hypothetical protein
MFANGCASAFPPGSLDYGRGASPMPRGTTRVQAGFGGGAAPNVLAVGVGAGGRVEHQLIDDLSLSADVGAGAQLIGGLGVTFPTAAYAGTQWNPLGVRSLALRLRVGGGLDVPLPFYPTIPTGPSSDYELGFPAPYAAAVGQVVWSFYEDGPMEAYVAPGVGVKQFFGSRDNAARVVSSLTGGTGSVDTIITPGVTTGLSAQMTTNLGFYLAGTLTPAILFGADATGKDALVAISPSAGVQTGLALVF